MINRRKVLALAALLHAPGLARAAPATDMPVMVDDITGTRIKLARPARRVVLAEGRQLVALSLLDREPASLLAGWTGDMRRNDRQTYALYRRKFPAIDAAPVVGAGNDGTLSVEQVISLKPDMVVLGLGFAPGGHDSAVARQLAAAGIPVAFTDFFVDPFRNTLPSMRILGALIGRGAEADAFAAFYGARMERIAGRLAAGTAPRPSVMVEAHAGMGACCFSPGRKNFGEFIAFAGGDNIAAGILPGPTGQLSLEYVLSKSPDVYVATGGAHLEAAGGLVIGPGYTLDTVQQRLAALAARPGFSSIRAVQEHRVHGLFHNLMATPLNVVATEALAKWLYPRLFADIDPAATLREINAGFLAVPFEGIYFADLP